MNTGRRTTNQMRARPLLPLVLLLVSLASCASSTSQTSSHLPPGEDFGGSGLGGSDRSRDSDGDGILDGDDGCRCEPEDVDGFEDENGCPDLDNDGDLILDRCDACPDEPEVDNGFQDEDGCPDRLPVVVSELRIEIQRSLGFGHGSATLPANANPLLDLMALVLSENPQVELVIVEGHANPRERRPGQLGRRRAEAVLRALIERGVDADRLTTRSHGAERPRADNGGAEGRAQNRRVELRIERLAATTPSASPRAHTPRTGPPRCPGVELEPRAPTPCAD